MEGEVHQFPDQGKNYDPVLRELSRIADEMREQTAKMSDISRDYAVLVETVNNHMDDDKSSFKRLEGSIEAIETDLKGNSKSIVIIQTYGSIGIMIFTLATSFTAAIAIWAAFFRGG